MVKEKAILAGPCYGELFWEFFRFAPYVFNVKKQYPQHKLIVATRPDRNDIYGKWADKFLPFYPPSDNCFADCFKMYGVNERTMQAIENKYLESITQLFDIDFILKPDVSPKQFSNKDQFPMNSRCFDYQPRCKNKEIVDEFIGPDKRPIIVIAPRFRKGFKRNWKHWESLYDLICYNKLHKNFNFVICGKPGEYIKEISGQFGDLNNIDFPLGVNYSLMGCTIELLKRAVLTIGSQSAIPNISLLMGTPVLQWGNQKDLHSKTYNIYKTPVHFIEDMEFSIPAHIVMDKFMNIVLEESESWQ